MDIGGRDEGGLAFDVTVPGSVVAASARVVEVGLRFGVALSVPARTVVAGARLDLRPGTITLVCGPSGSGKSRLLRAVAERFPASREVNQVPFPTDVSVVDAICPTRPLAEALGLLTACGFGEPRLWLRRFDQLSDGERFRARLARAIGMQQRSDGVGPLLCDEFGSTLHRRLARAIAFNLRKLTSRERLMLIVATGHEDLEADLRPDRIVRLSGESSICDISTVSVAGRSGEGLNCGTGRSQALPKVSFARRLRIERGALHDYAAFAGMHYRGRDRVGFVDRVFVMRDGPGGEPLGVVVYGHPALELSLRNRATDGRFVRNARRLNEEMRVLKRLVIHPDVRGCGLGHWLVRRTLPMAGTRFVECLAAMGTVNPVFVKGGMTYIGTCGTTLVQRRTLQALRSAGADPLAADFVSQVCRRPSLRKLVAGAVADWYRSTTAEGQGRVERQSARFLAQTFRQMAGSSPEYYLWARRAADRVMIGKRKRRSRVRCVKVRR